MENLSVMWIPKKHLEEASNLFWKFYTRFHEELSYKYTWNLNTSYCEHPQASNLLHSVCIACINLLSPYYYIEGEMQRQARMAYKCIFCGFIITGAEKQFQPMKKHMHNFYFVLLFIFLTKMCLPQRQIADIHSILFHFHAFRALNIYQLHISMLKAESRGEEKELLRISIVNHQENERYTVISALMKDNDGKWSWIP